MLTLSYETQRNGAFGLDKRESTLMRLIVSLLTLTLALLFAAPALAEPTEEWLELSVSTQAEADALYIRYAELFNGGDIRLKIEGERDVFIPFLQRFSFHTLALDTKQLETSSGIGISSVQGITELVCPYASVNAELSGLKRLTLCAYGGDAWDLELARIFHYVPDLEELSLRLESSWWSARFPLARGMLLPKNLKAVEVSIDGAPEILSADAMEHFIAALKLYRPDATLNGKPVLEWTPEKEIGSAAQSAIGQLANDTALCELFERLIDSENAVSGQPVLGEKLVVMIYYGSYGSGELETSLEAETVGSDFYGLPALRMAAALDEADTAIIVYRRDKKVGSYTNGRSAYGVDTMVGVVELESGTVFEPYVAAYSAPPQSIKMTGGGYGKFQPEKALEDIAQRLR